MNTNDGGPAFPRQHIVADANDVGFKMGCPGMTLRDYFAGQAMAATLTWAKGPSPRIAEGSYLMADAMLAEREKGEGH